MKRLPIPSHPWFLFFLMLSFGVCRSENHEPPPASPAPRTAVASLQQELTQAMKEFSSFIQKRDCALLSQQADLFKRVDDLAAKIAATPGASPQMRWMARMDQLTVMPFRPSDDPGLLPLAERARALKEIATAKEAAPHTRHKALGYWTYTALDEGAARRAPLAEMLAHLRWHHEQLPEIPSVGYAERHLLRTYHQIDPTGIHALLQQWLREAPEELEKWPASELDDIRAYLAFRQGDRTFGMPRDAAWHPFAVTSPWNTSLGMRASTQPVPWSMTDSIPLSAAIKERPILSLNALQRLPHQTETIADLSVLVPDAWRKTAQPEDVLCLFDESTGHYLEARYLGQPQAQAVAVDAAGSGWQAGVGPGGPALAGVIRVGEFALGIRHALALAIHPRHASGTAIWPAQATSILTAQKDRCTGKLAIGTLLGLPSTADPADYGALAPVARALQDYGAYVADLDPAADVSLLVHQAQIDEGQYGKPRVTVNLHQESAALTRLFTDLRQITDNTPKHPGGAGIPRQPHTGALAVKSVASEDQSTPEGLQRSALLISYGRDPSFPSPASQLKRLREIEDTFATKYSDPTGQVQVLLATASVRIRLIGNAFKRHWLTGQALKLPDLPADEELAARLSKAAELANRPSLNLLVNHKRLALLVPDVLADRISLSDWETQVDQHWQQFGRTDTSTLLNDLHLSLLALRAPDRARALLTALRSGEHPGLYGRIADSISTKLSQPNTAKP